MAKEIDKEKTQTFLGWSIFLAVVTAIYAMANFCAANACIRKFPIQWTAGLILFVAMMIFLISATVEVVKEE